MAELEASAGLQYCQLVAQAEDHEAMFRLLQIKPQALPAVKTSRAFSTQNQSKPHGGWNRAM